MRLIDADEFIERIKSSTDHYGTYGECEIHDIELAPTVDAIPVEWLLNHIPHDKQMEAYNKILIEYLVIGWRKENESI